MTSTLGSCAALSRYIHKVWYGDPSAAPEPPATSADLAQEEPLDPEDEELVDEA